MFTEFPRFHFIILEERITDSYSSNAKVTLKNLIDDKNKIETLINIERRKIEAASNTLKNLSLNDENDEIEMVINVEKEKDIRRLISESQNELSLLNSVRLSPITFFFSILLSFKCYTFVLTVYILTSIIGT